MEDGSLKSKSGNNYQLSEENEKMLFSKVQKGKLIQNKLDTGKNISDDEQNLLNEARMARNQIFAATVNLIDIIYYSYFTPDETIRDDARQEAAIVLFNCIDSFDPEKQVRFNTYASKALKRSIADTFIQRPVLCEKRGFLRNYWLLEKATAEFMKEYGREPTNDELINILPYGKRALKNAQSRKRTISLLSELNPSTDNEETSDDSLERRMSDAYATDSVLETVTCLSSFGYLYKQVKEQLNTIMNTYCTQEEQMMLDYRFGFHGEPLQDEEIAKKFNMTIAEVQTIWGRAVMKLEEPCRKAGLDNVL